MATEDSQKHSARSLRHRSVPPWLHKILDRRLADPSTATTAGFWSPPEDVDKPNLPYIAGFTAKIYKQTAPLGTTQSKSELSQSQLEAMTQSEAVVSSSPEYSEPSSGGQEVAQLTIAAPIDIGAARGPQLVIAMVTRVIGDSYDKPFKAVAKIYDPLYYSYETDIGHHPRDCVQDAQRDYTKEVTAYKYLQSISQTGHFAPEYYGSWVFSLPITIRGKLYIRTIHLVLIEHLKGMSILSTRVRNNSDKRKALDSFHYPEEYRLEVLARAMDSYVRLLRKGLVQGDFAARNIMLIAQSPATPEDIVCGFTMPRIVLIDYNNAYIIQDISVEDTKRLPANPASAFRGDYLWEDFPGWVPHEWVDSGLQQEWLMKRFTGPGREELYLPIPDDD